MIKESEHQIQKAIVQLLSYCGVMHWATPNGGIRDKVTASKLKREGVIPGVSDLIILQNSSRGPLFVEVKTSKGRQNENQVKFQEDVERLGYRYLIWRSVDDCDRWIKENVKHI